MRWDGEMEEPPFSHSRRRLPVSVPETGVRRRHLFHGGLSLAEVRRGSRGPDLERLGYDLYSGTAETLAREIRMLQALTAGTDSVVSHDTAAALHGFFDLPLSAPFHLSSPRGRPQVRRPELVVGHRMRILGDQVTEVLGIPVTTVARTWVDRAVGQSLEQAVIDADILLRQPRAEFGELGTASATPAQLAAAVRSRRKVSGIRTARLAADLARVGVDSPQETRLRLLLGDAGGPEPEVNGWVCWPDGSRAFQPDLLFRKYKVSVQYEGRHHSHPDQVERDVARADKATALGWTEVRITRRDMADGGWRAVRKVFAALRANGWPGP